MKEPLSDPPPRMNYLDTTTMISTTTTTQQQTARNEIDEKFLGLLSATGLTTPTSGTTTTQRNNSSTSPPTTSDNDPPSPKLVSLLKDLFPLLTETEIKQYVTGLQGIGFDPDCESRYYIQEDDLTFMKKLHRRYFVAEIVGNQLSSC